MVLLLAKALFRPACKCFLHYIHLCSFFYPFISYFYWKNFLQTILLYNFANFVNKPYCKSFSPSSESTYTKSATSSRYFLSWEILMIVPWKSISACRITGAERGEKFLVGSSRISTFAFCRTIFRKMIFARWPPLNSPMVYFISSLVNFMVPIGLNASVYFSLS
mgnify:CR=1 FL=1